MIPHQYQQLKLLLIEILSLSRDALHVHIGFLILLFTLLFTRKKLHQWSILIPVLVISVLAEAIDIWDELNTIGRILVGASLHDLLNTNLIPIILVIWARREHKLFTEV